MEDNLIRPTHTCFDDSIEIMQMLVNSTLERSRFYLVHALCNPDVKAIDPNGGEYTEGVISHAWVEVFDTDGQTKCMFKGICKGQVMTLVVWIFFWPFVFWYFRKEEQLSGSDKV